MNKMILFPLMILLLISVFSAVYTNSQPVDNPSMESYYDLELHDGHIYVVDNSVSPPKMYPTVTVMGDDGYDDYVFMTDDHKTHIYDPDEKYSDEPFQIWGMNAIIITIGGIIILVGALGISLFGSGFSTFTQEMALTSGVYFGLWGILSVFSANVLTDKSFGIFGSMLYFVLTVVYAIGVVSSINGD